MFWKKCKDKSTTCDVTPNKNHWHMYNVGYYQEYPPPSLDILGKKQGEGVLDDIYLLQVCCKIV